MANPQAENGHVDIANEIIEAIAKTHLSDYESRIIHALWRKTYGWHKKTDHISYSQWEDLTGLHSRHIGRTLSRLVQRNIITKQGNGYQIEYAFQKDYSRWCSFPGNHQALPKGVTEKALPIGGRALPIGVTEALPKEVDTKETQKKLIQKKVRRLPFSVYHFTEEERAEILASLETPGERVIMSTLFEVPVHWGKTAKECLDEYSKWLAGFAHLDFHSTLLPEVQKFRLGYEKYKWTLGWRALWNWLARVK